MVNGQKILLIDDSTFMRTIIKNILKKNGYIDIVEAEDGTSGMEQYRLEQPDLVILDIIMPSMGGIETLSGIMKIDKKAKVIMITAVGQETIIEDCKRIGSIGYITKPFKEKRVVETVQKIIGPGKITKKEKIKIEKNKK